MRLRQETVRSGERVDLGGLGYAFLDPQGRAMTVVVVVEAIGATRTERVGADVLIRLPPNTAWLASELQAEVRDSTGGRVELRVVALQAEDDDSRRFPSVPDPLLILGQAPERPDDDE